MAFTVSKLGLWKMKNLRNSKSRYSQFSNPFVVTGHIKYWFKYIKYIIL